MYNAIVTKLKNVRPHPNADKVQLATCHGNQVVIGLDSKEDHWGVYFPCDGQLSHEFCHANNLYRDKTKNKFPDEKPGMFDDNRRVRAQRFRGEISDGFWVPLHYFGFIYVTGLNVEGLEFDEWGGVPICNKYINPNTIKAAQQNQGKKTRVAKTSVMFKEHIDTEHFGKNVHQIKREDLVIITEKLHGTSHRVGNVLVDRDLNWFEKLLIKLGVKIKEAEWTYLNGTRRVVLEEAKSDATQFHDPSIRDKAFNLFKGNLRKGETVYLEIVGYESENTPIMPSVDTTKMGDKEFTKEYSNMGDKKHMVYSYGCSSAQQDFYVYRMTMTNVDGQSVDYSWDDVVKRCNEIGVKHVPEIIRFRRAELEVNDPTLVDDRNFEDKITEVVDIYSKGKSIVDNTHIKEGVCVRLESGLVPRIYKHKSFEFKVLEGIVKDSGVVDMEESS
jgi:hypothetical protein